MNHTTIKDNHATPAAESDDDLKATHQCVDAEHVQNMNRDGYCASCGYSILRDTPSEGQIRDAIAAMNITVTAAEHSPLPLPTVLKAVVNTLKQCQFEINLLPPKQKSTRQSCLVMIESTLGMIDRCRAVNEREELLGALRKLLDCETNLAGCSGVKLLDAVDTARAVLKRVEGKQ